VLDGGSLQKLCCTRLKAFSQATLPKGNNMTRSNIQEHLHFLLDQRAEAFSEGDWDRVDFIQLCIDDTEEQLNNFSS